MTGFFQLRSIHKSNNNSASFLANSLAIPILSPAGPSDTTIIFSIKAQQF